MINDESRRGESSQSDQKRSGVIPQSSGRPKGVRNCGSGYPLGASGHPIAGDQGGWEAFEIGSGVDQPSSIPFELAPRMYVLSQANSSSKGLGASAEENGPLDDLPDHLIFQEVAAATAAERSRQIWISEGTSARKWELVVEKYDGVIRATLVGRTTNGPDGDGKYVWKASHTWEPFGSNRLVPETNACAMPSLIVTAP